jgi:hypothetical protein
MVLWVLSIVMRHNRLLLPCSSLPVYHLLLKCRFITEHNPIFVKINVFLKFRILFFAQFMWRAILLDPMSGFVPTSHLCLSDIMLDILKLSVYDFTKEILASHSMASTIGLHRYKMWSSKVMLAHHWASEHTVLYLPGLHHHLYTSTLHKIHSCQCKS